MRRSRPRSSSADGRSWGSYKPSARRSTSESRNSAGVVNVLQRGMSPACGGKMSLGGLYSRNRGGSLLDGKRIAKDPRPLADKAYQAKCLSALVEFLYENKFPFSADVKKLMAPSKKDFERIFEFLYRYWEPKYVVGKIEDDAPKILKMLNYPFIIIKSTFVSVNRMTWPTLLGVLMWLMELNKFALNLDISAYFQTPDFDNGEEQYRLLNYILQSYSLNIDDPEKDREFFSTLITDRCHVEGSIEDLKKELRSRQEKLAEVQKEEENLNAVEKENEVLEGNIKKYDNFLAQMEKHSKAKEEECLELHEKLEQKDAELQLLVKATEEKERAYKQQGYDGQQKHQFLLVQKQNLSKELEEKKERLAKEEKAYWDLEIENSTVTNKVLALCREFNEKYASLPSTARDAILPLKKMEIPTAVKLCKDFKVDLPEFEIGQSSMMNDCAVLKSEIMPALDSLKAHLIKQKDYVNSMTAVQSNCLHELEMKMSELKIKTDLVKAQSVQKRREKDSNAREFDQEILQLQEKHDALLSRLEKRQKDLIKLEKLVTSLKQQIASNNGKIHEARTMYELYRTRAREIFEELKNDIRYQKSKCDEIQAHILDELNGAVKRMKNVRRPAK